MTTTQIRASAPVSPPHIAPFSRRNSWINILLIAIVLFTFFPVYRYGFIAYDDQDYITRNPNVINGLTWDGLVWAFTTGYAANWHPLTWLSHMLDVQLFGLSAGGHHVMNLLLHVANTALLFWLLMRTTGAVGPSVFVASLFGLHPLHVESVAWVAERKDVLSTFLGMLTLHAYVSYTRRPYWKRYVLVLTLFGMGLMAKPMLVTLPFVLLLLDYWPLGRLKLTRPWNLPKLFTEKIPLLALAAASSIVTIIVQQEGGALPGFAAVPFNVRLMNACLAYVTYLKLVIWPARLAVLYPLKPISGPEWLAAALALIAVSILCIWAGPRRPYIPVGWFWFLVTLAPVIGLIQVGRQAMADRYTYIPIIGVFFMVAFTALELASSDLRRIMIVAGGALTLIVCVWVTRRELRYWGNSEALILHTIDVTTDNSYALYMLGNVYGEQGKLDQAISLFNQALRINPKLAEGYYNLGVALSFQRHFAQAIPHYLEALSIKPQYGDAHHALAVALMREGKTDQAIPHYLEALRLKPYFAEAHQNLAEALMQNGRMEEAIAHYAEALRLKAALEPAIKAPLANAHYNLGLEFANKSDSQEAERHFLEAVRLNPGLAEAHNALGTLYLIKGELREAISQFSEAIRLKPDFSLAHNNLGIAFVNQGRLDEAIVEFTTAMRFDAGNVEAKANLAALRLNRNAGNTPATH